MSFKKVILSLFIFIIVAILGVGTYVYFNVQSIVNEVFREQIIDKNNNNQSSKYYIKLEKIKVNLVTGGFKLINLSIIPKDSLVILKDNLNQKSYASTTLKIHISEIALTGFDFFKAINERVLVAESFKIHTPKISVFQHDGIPKEEIKKQDTINIRQLFLAQFDTFRIDEINVLDAATDFYNVSTQSDTSLIYTLNNLSYQIFGVTANKNTLFSKQIISYDNYKLRSSDISISLPDGATVKVKKIRYDSDVNQLELSEISFKKNGNPKAFFKTLKYRKAWIKVAVDQIKIDNFDLDTWFDKGSLYASKLEVTSPHLQLFTNSKIPLDTNTVKPMLGEILQKLKIPYLIDTIAISDAKITLNMIGKVTNKHGVLTFHDMKIESNRFTNIPALLNEDPYLTMKVFTRLNKTGEINATLRFNQKSQSSLTEFKVDAKNLKLKNFTSVLKPILRISIKDGHMSSLVINSVLSVNGAYGTLEAQYTGLKLQLESKELAHKPGFFNNIASGLANGILKTDNVRGSKNYHKGKVKITKQPSDSFFKMLWMVTLTGLEDVILGSDKRDQRRIQKQNRKAEKKGKRKKRWKR